MAARFVNIDYDTPLLLPPNLRDWVPGGHLAHFILESVAEMDLRQVQVNERGSGCPQYPPRMLFLGPAALLLRHGRFQLAEIEARAQARAAEEDG